MNFISLSGKSNTGKSTVGALLKEKGWVAVSFADRLKYIVSIIFGWNIDILRAETPEHRAAREALPPVTICGKTYTYRQAFTSIGDMLRENMGERVIVEMLLGYIQQLLNSGAKVCVTDARYAKEVLALHGCRHLCLWRNPTDLTPLEGEHPSENDFLSLPKETFEYMNNSGTLEELKNLLNEF